MLSNITLVTNHAIEYMHNGPCKGCSGDSGFKFQTDCRFWIPGFPNSFPGFPELGGGTVQSCQDSDYFGLRGP